MITDSNFFLYSQQFLVTFWTTTRDPIATTTALTARTSTKQKQTTNKQQQAGTQQQIQHSIKIWTHKKKMPQFSKLNGCIIIQTLIVQTAEIQHLLARNNTQSQACCFSQIELGPPVIQTTPIVWATSAYSTFTPTRVPLNTKCSTSSHDMNHLIGNYLLILASILLDDYKRKLNNQLKFFLCLVYLSLQSQQ